ncbi:MAG: ATP-binding cassette domain-containing protein, partial [Firmicutes bacterium]|nr:ATP-binding cassette domain-containing protein [Bacillota bacterium]
MALLLRAESLRVRYGLRTIFTIDKIEIHDNDRIGLVGGNGAGKSTLLSVLHGEKTPDAGVVRRFAASAMVRQFGGAERVEEVDAALQARLGAKPGCHEGISGGELERVRVARALSTRAPLLFADEPTTNLDFDGLAEVQRALSRHQGALVLVSHDRALLDALCTVIWELEDGKLRTFPGDYAAYRGQKAREREAQRFAYEQYREEQARLRSAIAGMKESARSVRKAPARMGNSEARLQKRGKGTSAKARLERGASALQSRLDALDAKERPREEVRVKMALNTRDGITSAAAVRIDRLCLRAGERTLAQNVTLTLPTGVRTVLAGPNGCGKTTLLRAIRAGAEGVRKSPGVTIGWFGQETLDTLDLTLTLLENVMRDSVLPVHEARALMARMGLTSRDMDKPAALLSGGERAKA